jgi:hypothetical protein
MSLNHSQDIINFLYTIAYLISHDDVVHIKALCHYLYFDYYRASFFTHTHLYDVCKIKQSQTDRFIFFSLLRI